MHQQLEQGSRRRSLVAVSFMASLACALGACSASVYPASECKPPPPPLTIPNSPRSQCREVSTEHAKDWPQLYKDVQYLEENAVYRVRLAYSELADTTQKELRSEFAQAVVEINSADGKYLQLVDAAVGASSSDFKEATKGLPKALEVFVNFIEEHLKGPAVTPAAKKDLDKARAMLQQLNNKLNPPPPPEEGTKPSGDGKGTEENTEEPESNFVQT